MVNVHTLIRLVGAVLAEQLDEWAGSRRYLGLDVLSKSQATNAPQQNRRPPGRTDRLNHKAGESHDDVIHHVPGLDPLPVAPDKQVCSGLPFSLNR